MSLTSGTKLGPYEIVSLLGVGGMGEVYRARDNRLHRDVAIKVLPANFTADPERMARFQREAQLLASLNHPNIAAIFGLEEASGLQDTVSHGVPSAPALVMELVEGPTLAQRIASGPIPIEDTLPIARQIAEALEAAHEKGIIHRDLKPANIKLTPDGAVKVLDFGLAKGLDNAQAASSDPSNSPTFTAATQMGVILGTAAYMSPEQAKGKPLDRRADIWAFGCVLYEMLTARRAFGGEDITDTLAAVVRAEAEWSALPAETPPAIRRLLQRCLQKDPRERLRDIGDVRIELKQLLLGSGTNLTPIAEPIPLRRSKTQVTPWVIAALAVVAALAIFFASRGRVSEPLPVTRFAVAAPSGTLVEEPALSPDSSEAVFAALPGGDIEGSALYLRRFDQLQATAIPGTNLAYAPVFSPDGKWLAFSRNGALVKIQLSSGSVQTICPVNGHPRISWTSDNHILFTQRGSGLLRVSADGGTPELMAGVGPLTGSREYYFPSVLPGNKFAILQLGALYGGESATDIVLVRIDKADPSQEPKVLVRGARRGRFMPPDLLFFVRGASLFAVTVDVAQQKVTGSPIKVVDRLEVNITAPYFDVSPKGTVVYASPQSEDRKLVFVNRKGEEQPLVVPARPYWDPKLSPDGKRIAFTIGTGSTHSPWIYNIDQRTWLRLAFESKVDMSPVWSPDGRSLFYVDADGNILSKPADGSAPERTIGKVREMLLLDSITPDGHTLLGMQFRQSTGWDVVMLKLKPNGEVEGDPVPLMATPATEARPALSPDGHWLAYISDESGKPEVYVQSFPIGGGKWQVSSEGGAWPCWSHDGRQLYYQVGDAMMAVDVRTSPTFTPGTPHLLFKGRYTSPGGVLNYFVTNDDNEFLMMKEANDAPSELDVILNARQELQKAGSN